MPEDPDTTWTIREAAAYLSEAGPPVTAGRLALIIRGLEWTPASHRPPGPRGGRGEAAYPIDDWIRLHARITPWLLRHGGPGQATSSS